MDKGVLRQTLAAIQTVIEPGAVRRSMRILLERERQANRGSVDELAGRMAEALAGTLCEVYCAHVGRYLEAVGCAQPMGQALEDETRSFGQAMFRLLLPLAKDEAKDEAKDRNANEAKDRNAKDEAKDRDVVRPAEPQVHPLRDAFGRALFLPVESRYSIVDRAEGIKRTPPSFPRPFCSPVLAEIKFRLIGDDKYDTTNTKLLSSIQKYCQVGGQLDRSKMREYFLNPALRQYLMAYSLHLLKYLMGEERRETFLSNVNVRVRKKLLETAPEFGTMHLSMLTSSWALFVFDNLDEVYSRGAAPRILRHYIPGKMEAMDA